MLTFSQNTYGAAIETLEQIGKVVDSLYAKVRMFALPVSGQLSILPVCRRSRLLRSMVYSYTIQSILYHHIACVRLVWDVKDPRV